MEKKKLYNISPIKAEDSDAVLTLVKSEGFGRSVNTIMNMSWMDAVPDSSVQVFSRTFYIDEPLNQAVGLCSSETDPCPELDEYSNSGLLSGFSFKVTDDEGNIIGAMISGICPLKEDDNGNDLLSQAQRCRNPKFQKILYILARRESGAKLWEKFPNDEICVEIKIAATDPKWRKKGIMNALLEKTEKAIKEKNIRLLRLDTSSAYSAMVAERYGYKCYYNEPYKNIKMDGQPLIVPEPPHVDDRVYIKELF